MSSDKTGEHEKLVNYAKAEVEAKFDAIMDDMDGLTKTANFTFGFIATAMSGIFGYTISLMRGRDAFAQNWTLIIPLLLALGHLFIIGRRLLLKAMLSRAVTHRGNEPSRILTNENKEFPASAVIEIALANIETAISANSERNQKTAKEINTAKCRLLWTPVIFSVAWAVLVLVEAWAA